MSRHRSLFLTVLLGAVAALVLSLALTVAPVGAALPGLANTKPVTVVKHPKPTPLILDARLGRHAHFDRLVLDVSGPLTGYDVRYVRTLTYDGSGKTVPLKGKAFLQIRVSPANAHCHNGLNVYSGPRLTRPGMPTIKGLAFTGDFEAVVSFGLALDHKAGFRVFILHQPNRIVIDVAR